jgi:hypothetical protein
VLPAINLPLHTPSPSSLVAVAVGSSGDGGVFTSTLGLGDMAARVVLLLLLLLLLQLGTGSRRNSGSVNSSGCSRSYCESHPPLCCSCARRKGVLFLNDGALCHPDSMHPKGLGTRRHCLPGASMAQTYVTHLQPPLTVSAVNCVASNGLLPAVGLSHSFGST